MGRQRRHHRAGPRRRDRRRACRGSSYVSTVNVFGNTKRRGGRRDLPARPRRGLPVAGTTRRSTARTRSPRQRIARGAPIVIVMPSQVYGPHDHSLASEQLHQAFTDAPLPGVRRSLGPAGCTSTTWRRGSSPRSTVASVGRVATASPAPPRDGRGDRHRRAARRPARAAGRAADGARPAGAPLNDALGGCRACRPTSARRSRPATASPTGRRHAKASASWASSRGASSRASATRWGAR